MLHKYLVKLLQKNTLSNQTRYTREWLYSLFLVFFLSVTAATAHIFKSADQFLYDSFLTALPHSADPRLLIISVDKHSIEQIGSLPWSRNTHAELLTRLQEAQSGPVLLNFEFNQADQVDPKNDEQLAKAMRISKVFIPALINDKNNSTLEPPLPSFREAAAGMGLINLTRDSDAIPRSIYLRAQVYGVWWHQVAIPMARSLGALSNDDAKLPGTHYSLPVMSKATTPAILFDNKIGVAVAESNARVAQVSYADVLYGKIPDAILRNKIILVGENNFRTEGLLNSSNNQPHGGLSSLEFEANILDNLLNDRTIESLSNWQALLITALPILLLMFGYFVMPSLLSITFTGGVILVWLGLTYFVLRIFHIWIEPTASIFGIFTAFLLWNWRSLAVRESSTLYAINQFKQVKPLVLLGLQKENQTTASSTDENVDCLQETFKQLQDVQQFINQTINGLPIPVCICNDDNQIVLANKQAVAMFGEIVGNQSKNDHTSNLLKDNLSGHNIVDLLRTISGTMPSESALNDARNLQPIHLLVRDPLGRSLRVDSTVIHASQGNQAIGWLYTFIDLTVEKRVEHQRATLLRFLSHDLRKPQSSILSLLRLQNVKKYALSETDLYQKIAAYATRTLTHADSFVYLNQAEQNVYDYHLVDAATLLLGAIDQVSPNAQFKNISISHHLPEHIVSILADVEALIQAFVNLLDNAVQYSPANTTINVQLKIYKKQQLEISIADQGVGIAPEDFKNLFQPLVRDNSDLSNFEYEFSGHGLGLVQTRVAIERHGGTISCVSNVGVGTTFKIVLPLHDISTDKVE